jgi:hypothetical protein
MFLITDQATKPGYIPNELLILKTYGNGLCWINALLVTIFGKFWLKIDQLDMWIQSLIATFNLDDNFVQILKLYSYNIELNINPNGISEFDIIKFLNSNKILIYILSFNILKFSIENYDNPLLNRVEKLCPLETGIAFNNKNQNFEAIDGQLRNFIIAIMGIKKVIVFQNKVDQKYRRYSNTDLNLLAIDYEGEYAGFEIEAFHNINSLGILGEVLLFTHDSYHYDAVFDSNAFETCLAITDQFETLPKFIAINN